MSFFDGICINSILIMFPLLVYIIYFVASSKLNSRKQKLAFEIALIASMLLILIYGIKDNIYISIVLNIPLLFSYLKGEKYTPIIITIILIIYYIVYLKVKAFIIVFEYILYYIVILICRKKNIRAKEIINISTIIKTFFISFYTFYYIYPTGSLLPNMERIVVSTILFYVISQIYYQTIQKTKDILELYNLTTELEKEKEIKNSLFRITHEIKNPIAVCKGYLDMSDHKKIDKYLPIIRSEMNRTLKIMEDLLDCTKVKISKEMIDLNLLIEESFKVVSLLTKDNTIIINYECEEEEVYFMGDYDRLKQVLMNLVKNSIEAKKDNQALNILIKGEKIKGNYIISITDDGIGMSETDFSKVGEMFFTTKRIGTGIGITLSKEIIDRHAGTLDYESKEGKGTKVIITLPVDKYLNCI